MRQVRTLYKASLQMNQILDTEVPRMRARDNMEESLTSQVPKTSMNLKKKMKFNKGGNEQEGGA